MVVPVGWLAGLQHSYDAPGHANAGEPAGTNVYHAGRALRALPGRPASPAPATSPPRLASRSGAPGRARQAGLKNPRSLVDLVATLSTWSHGP